MAVLPPGRLVFRSPAFPQMRRTMNVGVNERDRKAKRFEESRRHLRSVAYRMLGSVSEAEDAVQETWLRFSRSDTSGVENVAGWLTTVVARVCLDGLRARSSRREEPLDGHVPDPIVTSRDASNPEEDALRADSLGLALLVILETLEPAERLAFVLHDTFDMPFAEIAPIVGRSPVAARQLASRARRRVQEAPVPDPDRTRQWEAVDAFLAAARGGDLSGLVAVLDPDVVLRADVGAAPAGASAVVRGARAVAERAAFFSRRVGLVRPALVNGAPGVVSFEPHGRPFSVMGFTVTEGRIVEIDVLADPERLRRLDLPAFSV
jgi:RNA polymerase sigma-70 factor, ECF subfamily